MDKEFKPRTAEFIFNSSYREWGRFETFFFPVDIASTNLGLCPNGQWFSHLLI